MSENFSKIALPHSVNYINFYLLDGWLLKFFILQLSGLPPFFIFFLKVHYLITALNYLGFTVTILFFFNILFSMFYYLKMFMIPSLKNSDVSLKSNAFYFYEKLKTKQTKKKYMFIISATLFIFFNCLSFSFLGDVIFIINNFFA